MKLIIASNNRHKIREIKQILSPYYSDIVSLKEAGIDIDVEEDGTTFEENAYKKASEVFAIADADAVLSDDSGLEVDALGGAPGIYSARYSGEGHDDQANNDKLVKELENVEDDKRTARYVCAIALVRRDKEAIIRRGTVEGKILRNEIGENGFGYDPLFYYEPTKLTFAQMSAESKNDVSHRKNALEAVRSAIEAENKK